MKKLSRREFLSKSATAGTVGSIALGLGAPFVRTSWAADPGPNSRVRVALIGSGGMGRGDLATFFQNAEVECPVICDVDDGMAAKGAEVCQKQRGKKPELTRDFRRVLDRKDIDAVIIATPDHWHALPTVMACQAGMDVYVEKPLATTIDEGKAMVEAARRHKRVVQMGSQWRSSEHIIEATDFIKSGKLGKVSVARAWAYLDWLPTIGNPPDGNPPANADYDLWLGPAPKRPFNPNRFHFNFRWFWDYAGGLMTDWGVHLLNMALMGMGPEAPKTASSGGGKFVFEDNSETPDSQITTYEFPDYMLVWEHIAGLNNGLQGRSWGVQWSGSEGTVILNDSGWEIITERKKANLDSERKPGSKDPRPAHVRNFLDCMKTRKQPVLDVEKGQHVSTVAHLGNIAYRTSRKVHWDAAQGRVVGDKEADKLVGVKYRKPWTLPYSARA
jgi:predicted dehydrogenase